MTTDDPRYFGMEETIKRIRTILASSPIKVTIGGGGIIGDHSWQLDDVVLITRQDLMTVADFADRKREIEE